MTTANPHAAARASTAQPAAPVVDPAKATKEAVAEEVPAKRSVTFALVLTVLAVFPIAIGVGVVRLKASSAATARTDRADEEDEHAEKVDPQLLRADRRIGDREFMARRYEVALRYFQSLGSDDPTRQLPELQYRIALCQEGLGLWNEALANLQLVSGNSADSILKAAAIFGQARLCIRKNEVKNAESLLRSLVFQASSQTALPPTLQQEIDFLLPITLAHRTASAGIPGFDDAIPPLGEVLIWSLETALEWADGGEKLSDPSPDASLPANALSCRLKKSPFNIGDSSIVATDTIDLRCENQSLTSILNGLAAECGWQVDWSDLPKERMQERPVNLSFANRPLSLVLTLLASEMRATWSIDGNILTLRRLDPDGARSRSMISTTLAHLQNWIPTHRLVVPATFFQALLAHCDGNEEQAVQFYLTLVGRDSTPVPIRSSYNLASIYTHNGDDARAAFQLRYVVDGAPGHVLHAPALLQLGRLLLDLGDAQEATFQFRRATEAVDHPAEQSRAAVMLGLAYLTLGKYQEAAEAILSFKPFIEEPEVRTAAAFVTSYARWFSISEEMREREAAFLYRALIAMQDNADWMGQTGQLLIGRAFAELGFDDQTSMVYLRALKGHVTEAIRDEMTFALAELDTANGRTDSAKQLWEKMTQGTSIAWSNRARLRLAELALSEGAAEECLAYCEKITSDEGIQRRNLYRTMGPRLRSVGKRCASRPLLRGATAPKVSPSRMLPPQSD